MTENTPSGRLLSAEEIQPIYQAWFHCEVKSFEALIVMAAQSQDIKSTALDKAEIESIVENSEIVIRSMEKEIAELKAGIVMANCLMDAASIKISELQSDHQAKLEKVFQDFEEFIFDDPDFLKGVSSRSSRLESLKSKYLSG